MYCDGEVAWDDVTYLVNFYFLFGDAPVPYESGDLNLDGVIDIADLVWLAYYLNDYATPPCYRGTSHRDVKKASRDESEY